MTTIDANRSTLNNSRAWPAPRLKDDQSGSKNDQSLKYRPAPVVSPRDRRCNLLILGQAGAARSIGDKLQRLGCQVRDQRYPDQLLERLDWHTAAIIVAPPIGSLSSVRVCARIRQALAGAAMPIYVVIEDEIHQRRARALATTGVTALFAWPDERLVFFRTLFRVISLKYGRLARDQKTSRAVATSAERNTAPSESVATVAANGVAMIEGQVRGLWRVRELEKIMLAKRGINKVIADNLRVETPKIDDDALQERIKRKITLGTAIDTSRLDIRVDNGVVTVAGHVACDDQCYRLRSIVEHTRGVCALEDAAISVAPTAKPRAPFARDDRCG
jgi:osmotically-inducible protein OsmY